ncbi:MAG: glycerate kinase [bacterium]
MRIIIAPDSFKGSLTAAEVAEGIERGVKRALPQVETITVPLADGGEGTVDALVSATGGRIRIKEVTGPLGERVEAQFGLLGDGETAVIEMATASGLPLVPPGKRNPMLTTTYGTGELILAALEEGCRRIIIGIGGSATNDGGAGMAQALGVKLLDEKGQDIPYGAAGLARLARIDVSSLDRRLAQVEVLVACDVDNPLTGPRGAARVYGPQKGADPQMVEELDQILARFAAILLRDLGIAVQDIPGAGAAGGLGAGLLAFLKGRLAPGVELVLSAVKLEERIQRGADLIITGEGAINGQTVYGKAPIGVARLAKKYQLPVIAITGSIEPGAEAVLAEGIDAVAAITPGPISLAKAMERAGALVTDCAERVMRLLVVGGKISSGQTPAQGG